MHVWTVQLKDKYVIITMKPPKPTPLHFKVNYSGTFELQDLIEVSSNVITLSNSRMPRV